MNASTDKELVWKKDAKCKNKGAEFFFPSRYDQLAIRNAKEFCKGCPVMEPCLEFGLTLHVHGVWGGTSELERKRIRRKRNNI